jgi:hypothetical protein
MQTCEGPPTLPSVEKSGNIYIQYVSLSMGYAVCLVLFPTPTCARCRAFSGQCMWQWAGPGQELNDWRTCWRNSLWAKAMEVAYG